MLLLIAGDAPGNPVGDVQECGTMSQSRRQSIRGFTLVELMAVVVIVGVLATMAIVLVGKHVNAARTAEALAMVQSIRAAEESYRAENRRYLSVSQTLQDYYPAEKPDKQKRAFYRNAGQDLDLRWNLLRPTVSGPVRFVYAVVAGDAGDTPPLPSITDKPAFAAARQPFYVIQAAGDADGDGQYCIVAATSLTGEIYVENDGE